MALKFIAVAAVVWSLMGLVMSWYALLSIARTSTAVANLASALNDFVTFTGDKLGQLDDQAERLERDGYRIRTQVDQLRVDVLGLDQELNWLIDASKRTN